MNYLLLGEDAPSKDQYIKTIKQPILDSAQAERFDYDVLYGHKLDSDDLSKALKSLPAVAKQRVIVLHQIKKLSKHNQDILLSYLESPADTNILIMDDPELEATSAFVKSLPASVKVVVKGAVKALNVFDITNAMAKGDGTGALKHLNALFSSGVHPLQIIGSLTWYWGKAKARVSKDKFKIGLHALQETDLNIKRSRLKADHAVEILVVKLLELERV